ncbi:RNA methyltransferase [Chlamydia pecorum PV3056/3]|uniref:RsmB/NOP family class I SAM-dependent RNA methyltransferase n=1 Tax=Chlamydia pecorum TaxID=85991 RepID=UPI0003AD7A79|nr:RsmB/NOP family class I SAM-dependent RNA methyltransferase [Chlamydia pecorum]AGW37578.1 RNA methyltransferase [Chlamydia pecorum PV3056/3]
MVSFRHHHAYQLLQQLYTSPISEADRIAFYCQQHRALGAKDRKWLRNIVFLTMRHRRLLEFLIFRSGEKPSPQSLVAKIEEGVLEDLEAYQEIPWPVRYSISDDLARILVRDFGELEAQRLARVWLTEAPITVRVNTQKTSVGELQKILGYPSSPGELVPEALHFDQRYPLQSTPAFKQGLFELQDEHSQYLALGIPMAKTECVLDFCAGAGGKSLIFAQKAKHVVLHDSRRKVLQKAKSRLLRAGARNFSLQLAQENLRQESFATVVVDAPCSGCGIFRRHPEKKWQFSERLLKNYCRVQREILACAAQYVRRHGRLVYLTCSILKAENEHHCAYMRSLGWKEEKRISLRLEVGKGDGFFAAYFRKSAS